MNPKVGDIAVGTVIKVCPTFAILLFDEGWTGLLHISELSSSYIRSFTNFVTIGSIYNVKVIAVDEENGAIKVSLKQMGAADRKKAFRHKKIDPSEIDFSELEKRLPEWIKAENQGEMQ
jgi:S1 RNA binding domain protein